jgi:hypothetical protein
MLKNKFKVPNRKSNSSNIGKNIEKHKKTITKNAKVLEKEENMVAPLISQKKLDKIFIFLKYLFYMLLVSGIFFYLRRFFTKSKERNYSEESIDIKQLRILQSEYRKIMKKKLAPKIEIIQLYNYIKSVIKEYHYTQGEVPPPNILLKEYDVLSEIKGLNQMTTVFCHCFYGNGDLSKSEHRLFRKNSKKMLRHYSIL